MKGRRFLTMSVLGLLTVGALALTSTGGMASHDPTKNTQQLAQENALLVSQTTVYKVVLSEAVKLHFRPAQLLRPGSIVEARGAGRVSGVVLVPEGGSQPAFAALKFRECSAPGCQGGASMRASIPFAQEVNLELPARTYELYAVADGSPTRITLRLDGLAGRSRLGKGVPASLDLKTPTPSVEEEDGATFYDASDTIAFTSDRGLAFSATWVRGDNYKGSRINYCFAPVGEVPADNRTARACANPLSAKGTFGDEFQLLSNREGRFVLFTVGRMGPRQLDPEQGGYTEWRYDLSAFSPGEPVSVGSHVLSLNF